MHCYAAYRAYGRNIATSCRKGDKNGHISLMKGRLKRRKIRLGVNWDGWGVGLGQVVQAKEGYFAVM